MTRDLWLGAMIGLAVTLSVFMWIAHRYWWYRMK